MNKQLSAKDLARIAMGAVLITVCSWLSIPLTIPVTLQTFAVCLITAVLGLKLGFLSVLLYILLGLIGLPVFSGFAGGIAKLMGPTGGYIIGFLFTALIVGLMTRRSEKLGVLVAAMVIGILVCYAFGTAWFMLVYAAKTGPISLMTALGWCVLPYLVPDGVKILLAAVLVPRLRPLLMKG